MKMEGGGSHQLPIEPNISLDKKVSEYLTNTENGTSLEQYLKEIGDKSLLTKDQERELLEKAQGGDRKARNEMMEHNLKLAFWIAKKYKEKIRNNSSVSFEDLVQEANLGLVKAIEKFDLNMDTKFSTYAFNWITLRITRFIDNHSREIRIPIHTIQDIRQYNKAYSELEKNLQNTPTPEQIAIKTNLDVNRVIEIQNLLNYKKVSLDKEHENEDGNLIINQIENTDSKIDELVNNLILHKDIKVYLKKILTEKEYDILSHRFGLDGQGEYKLQEIGDKYGVSRERIRQIEKGAVEKLLNDPKMHNFNKAI